HLAHVSLRKTSYPRDTVSHHTGNRLLMTRFLRHRAAKRTQNAWKPERRPEAVACKLWKAEQQAPSCNLSVLDSPVSYSTPPQESHVYYDGRAPGRSLWWLAAQSSLHCS